MACSATNIGIPSQFGTNAYLTNMGSSNYHGMLRHPRQEHVRRSALRIQLHLVALSIDNTSVSANS